MIQPHIYLGLPSSTRLLARIPKQDSDYNKIIDSVCASLVISRKDILSKTSIRTIVEARFIAIGLILEVNPSFGLKRLGKVFGKNHATIIHSRNQYNNLMGVDKSFTTKVNEVLKYV